MMGGLNGITEPVGSYGTILYKDEGYKIQGAIIEVYREMGCGFLEPVYQECLEQEFQIQNIPYKAQCQLALNYKGRKLNKFYVPDFICYEKIIIELKALQDLTDDHRAQMLNYLKATGLHLGLLVNFGHYPRAAVERIIL